MKLVLNQQQKHKKNCCCKNCRIIVLDIRSNQANNQYFVVCKWHTLCCLHEINSAVFSLFSDTWTLTEKEKQNYKRKPRKQSLKIHFPNWHVFFYVVHCAGTFSRTSTKVAPSTFVLLPFWRMIFVSDILKPKTHFSLWIFF